MKLRSCVMAGLVFLNGILCGNVLAREPAIVETDTVTGEISAARMPVSGVIISRDDAAIATELTGRLTWIADVGDRLAQGEVLARLDTHLIELAKRDGEAEVKRLQANLAWLRRQTQRLDELATKNNTAHSELDEVRSRTVMLQQELTQAELELERTLYDLARAEIRAPFSGVVVSRQISAGEYANAGQALLRLVNTESAEISVTAPLRLARFIQAGEPVTVENEDFKGRAIVKSLVPVGDSRSHMMELRIRPEPGHWLIGEAVTVSLPASERRQQVTVDRDALVLRDRNNYVYVVGEDSVVQRVTVSLGSGLGERIAVTGQLRVGDLVVVRGAERLKDGQQVQRLRDKGAQALAQVAS